MRGISWSMVVVSKGDYWKSVLYKLRMQQTNCSQSILLDGFLTQLVSRCLFANIFATVLSTEGKSMQFMCGYVFMAKKKKEEKKEKNNSFKILLL